MTLVDFDASRGDHFFVIDERWNYQIEQFIRNRSVEVTRVGPTILPGFTFSNGSSTTPTQLIGLVTHGWEINFWLRGSDKLPTGKEGLINPVTNTTRWVGRYIATTEEAIAASAPRT